ncbi:unnamed protein product [Closterium sp. NIES-54]
MSQSLELNQRHHVMHLLPEVDCGLKAWTVLKELHAPTSVVATLMLERELSTLRLSEGEPVQPVLDKMRDHYAKLATAGITYPEQTKCLKMLSLLPESWLQFTRGLSLPQNQSLWTLEWVRTKILEEDVRRRQLRGGDDGSSGYGMQGSKRGRGRGFGGAGRGAKKDDDSNDQQGGTGWGRGAKSGRGGKSEKKKERTAGQFFHIGEQGEQGDASAKKVQQPHQPQDEVLAGVDWTAAWAKASSGSGVADWEIWHERFCYINIPMLQNLVKYRSLKGSEVKGAAKEIGSCPTCLETKFTKFPFSSSTGPAKAPLALVHMDVVGPTRAPSLLGSRYFLTIMDDQTRAVWVHPLKTNEEVAAAAMGRWQQLFLRTFGCMLVPKEKRGKLEASGRWGVHLGIANDHKGWLLWDLINQKLTVSRDVKFLESLYYKEWKQQQHKLPTTSLIIEAYEVQRPLRQVEVSVSEEEISGMTEDEGEPEVEEQQQQGAPPCAPRPPDRPRRDVRPPTRLTYPSRGTPKVVRAGSVAEQCDEDEIAHCY